MRNYQEMNDHELDDLFREAYSESGSVPDFTPEFWSEMEALLPSAPAKKRVPFYWWAAALVALFFGIFFWFNGSENSASVARELSGSQLGSTHLKAQKSIDKAGNSNKVGEVDSKRMDPKAHLDQPENTEDLLSPVLAERVTTSDQSTPVIENKCSEEEFFPVLMLEKRWFIQEGEILPRSGSSSRSVQQHDRYFVQFSTGLGTSYQRQVAGHNDLLISTGLSAGVRTAAGSMEMQAGIGIRSEFVNNVIWNRTSNMTVNGQPVLRQESFAARQLYSLEFPLALGWNGGVRHSVLASITPGIQLAGFGKATEKQNEQLIADRKWMQNMNDSKTMTMEIGVAYYYRVGAHYQLGCAGNVDVIRPFNTAYYLGETRHFPVNFQFSIRRYFGVEN